jgi:hypothetical protein
VPSASKMAHCAVWSAVHDWRRPGDGQLANKKPPRGGLALSGMLEFRKYRDRADLSTGFPHGRKIYWCPIAVATMSPDLTFENPAYNVGLDSNDVARSPDGSVLPRFPLAAPAFRSPVSQ